MDQIETEKKRQRKSLNEGILEGNNEVRDSHINIPKDRQTRHIHGQKDKQVEKQPNSRQLERQREGMRQARGEGPASCLVGKIILWQFFISVRIALFSINRRGHRPPQEHDLGVYRLRVDAEMVKEGRGIDA